MKKRCSDLSVKQELNIVVYQQDNSQKNFKKKKLFWTSFEAEDVDFLRAQSEEDARLVIK